MDNNSVINQLSTEVDNLMRIYQGLAAHIDGGLPGISQLRSQEIRQLGTAIQSLDQHIQILSRQISLDQTQNVRPESDKTYSVTYSDEGWRIHFQPNIAPHFGMEPSRSLPEVIKRVENLHPDYRPQLTRTQLADYLREKKAELVSSREVHIEDRDRSPYSLTQEEKILMTHWIEGLDEEIQRIDRQSEFVENPDYRPRLSNVQLADYACELGRLVQISPEPNLRSEAAKALMRCVPANLPASKRIVLQEQAERAFRNGQELSDVIKELTQLEQKQQQHQARQRAQTL